jgi:hypothetical protein
MRRILVALISAVLVAIASVAPAMAAKPDHFRPGVAPPTDIPDVCDFAITLTSTVDTSKVTVWEEEDGTLRILNRGYASGTATNTEDGTTYTHGGGFRVSIIVHPDGSVDVDASGNLFAWYYPGDPIIGLSDGVFAVSGRGSESYAPDGSLIAARFYGGHAVDLCELLAPHA